MITQQIKNLLLVAIVVMVIIILASFLVIGFNRMTAQAQSDLSLFSRINQSVSGHRQPVTNEKQGLGADIVYQDVYTNGVNLGNVGIKKGQLKAVEDLQSVIPTTGINAKSIDAGYEHIPSSAFRHDGGFSPPSGYHFVPVRGYIHNKSSGMLWLVAPVYVPNDVTLTEFSMFFVDDNAASDLEAYFMRKNLASPGEDPDFVSSLEFPGTDKSTILVGSNSIEPGMETVSNNYGYYIALRFGPDADMEQLVYGFIVKYQ